MDDVIAKWLAAHPEHARGMSGNPHATKYFAANPKAKYWYYSHSIRIPNPQLRYLPDWESDPWPTAHEMLNSAPGSDCQ